MRDILKMSDKFPFPVTTLPTSDADATQQWEGGLDPAARPVRVALVDDDEGIHQFLAGAFRKHASQWILDGYRDATSALSSIPKVPPQAVIMDIVMPGIQGIECAKRLKHTVPDLPILMLSAHVDAETLGNCLMAGASGCVFKPAATGDILEAVRRAMAGSLAFCPRAEKSMLEYFANLGKKYDGWALTRREREVLDCIRRQQSDKEIAAHLNISPSTVHVHMASLFKKLNVHTRAEVVMKIME